MSTDMDDWLSEHSGFVEVTEEEWATKLVAYATSSKRAERPVQVNIISHPTKYPTVGGQTNE